MHKATLLLAAFAVALPAGANTITVSSPPGYDAGCSLTEAVQNANAGGAPQPECAAGAPGMDVIAFTPELYESAPVLLGVSGTAVTEPITVDGPGVYLVTISGLVFESGASGSRIEDVNLQPVRSNGADLTLTRVRLANGRQEFSTYGGGIGITDASLDVSDSEISGNTVRDAFDTYPHFGGGIGFQVATAGTHTLALTNVTLSGNYAGTSGGGLAVAVTAAGGSAVVNLTHVTLADNRAGTAGGGLYLEPGAGSITVNLTGVVAGDNTAPTGSPSDLFESDDTTLNLVHSIVETPDGFAADSSTASMVGSDAGLARLGCNGSTQRTIALQPSSPAIDFVPAAACTPTSDQRGTPRPADGNGDSVADCDAGALEDQGPGDLFSSFYTLTPCRLIDTRSPEGVDFGGPSLSFPGSYQRNYDIAGRCGIPASASALAINVTVTNATNGGTITLLDPEDWNWFGSTGLHTLSSSPFIYFGTGRTRANNGVIPFCTDVGVVRALAWFDRNSQGDFDGSVDFILDVVGYFE